MHSGTIDWSDLRHVLALAQHQTMAAAAGALRVHQTTLSRRIFALEARLQTRLFHRIDGRFTPTARGMVVVRRAQEMESASLALHDDLAHREADIAIRYVRPAQGQSAVRKIGELGSAAYAPKALLRPGMDWRRELPWIGFAHVADRWPEFRWIEANVPPERLAMAVNGGPAYTEVVSRGYGAGLLTCIEGDARAQLQRRSGPEPLIVREIWILVLPQLRRDSAVRRVLDWIIAVTRREAKGLLGSPSRAGIQTD